MRVKNSSRFWTAKTTLRDAALPALLAFGLAGPACGLAQTGCDPRDVFCDLSALWLYNAPCHSRSWSTYYGAPAGTGEFAEGVVQAADSGYVIAGRAFDPFGTPIRAFENPGTRNIMVIKFTEDGAYAWHTFIGQTADRAVSITATGDGYLILGAASVAFGTPRQAFTTANDTIVAKIDLNGNLLWHTYFGTGATEEATQIVADGAGNYVLSGKSVGNIGNAGTIVVSNTNPGTDQMFVMKIDGEGTPLWQSHFGGAGGEVSNGIARFRDGFVVGGQSDAAFAAAFTNQRNAHTGGGINDFALVGIDTNGNYLWHTFQGATGQTDDLASVESLADGRLIVAGQSSTNWGTPVNPHPDPGANPAMSFFTLQTNGDLDWNAFYGNAGGTGSTMSRATQLSNGEISFLGGVSASFGVPRKPYQGLNDYVVGALDASTGFLIRHGFYGGPATAELALPKAFAPACDNGYLISGASTGNFGSPIVPYAGTGNQGFVLKLSPSDIE